MAIRNTFFLIALSALGVGAAAQPGVERITVTGRAGVAIGGFGNLPLASSPMQASIFGADTLADAGVADLAGLPRLDAGLSDAYNAEGYWSSLTVRGYVIDNRSNYRRDGLPVNAETAIGLANKERVEVLKGTSGMMAGVSAPGGLVNLVVKRPTARLRQASLGVSEGGSIEAAADWSERFGADGRVGLRVNLASSRLRPQTHDADGERWLLAVAGDVQIDADRRLEADIEWSRQNQPSVPGFSLRGSTLPDADAIDPRLNLNNQPWSQPVVLAGRTASVRWRQRLGEGWWGTAHAVSQRLTSDDRIAFPFGCYDPASDIYHADGYCPDGSFDLYDYRSDGERRSSDAVELQAEGRARTGGVEHELALGTLFTHSRDSFQPQAFNYAGTGRDDGSLVTPAAPDLFDVPPGRDERSTELFVRDRISWGGPWSVWGGLRHTRLRRDPDQQFTTPWVGLARQWDAQTLVYVSWGQGIETDVAPTLPIYTNAGQALPALKSSQWEAGVKHQGAAWRWSLIGFDIRRPQAVDLGDCDVDASCLRAIDGDARHRGLEAAAGWRAGRWDLQASAQWLHARREGASDTALNGLRPVNVPERSLRASAAYTLAGGLRLSTALIHEGQRVVLPDNSVQAPGWTRIDAAAQWQHRSGAVDWTWRAGIDNLTDTRAWRDTPYQFSHVYLFPLAPRAWRLSVRADF